MPENSSRPNPLLEQRFEQLTQGFLAFCQSDSLLPEELHNPPVFFNAPQVKKLMTFTDDHEEFMPALLETLAQIGQMSIYRGSLLGYLIGLFGEKGYSNPQTDAALVDFYHQVLQLNEQYVVAACRRLGVEPRQLAEDDALAQRLDILPPAGAAPNQPQLQQAWCAFSPLSFGLMSRLAASRPAREKMRGYNANGRLPSLCRLLSEWHDAVGYIPYMLDVAEDELALIIAPATGRGVEVRLQQIDSNNVFFTLLQFALYHKNLLNALGAGPFTYDPVIEKIALHQPVDEEEYPEQLSQQGCLGYYNWRAMGTAGIFGGRFDEMQAVWGEGCFAEIPRLNGRPVILVGKPQILRSWGQAFVSGTHSNLQPSVEILRELSPAEVQLCLAEIQSASRHQSN